jgi:hypothetical protein
VKKQQHKDLERMCGVEERGGRRKGKLGNSYIPFSPDQLSSI